jgi:hypothetical protein
MILVELFFGASSEFAMEFAMNFNGSHIDSRVGARKRDGIGKLKLHTTTEIN